MGGVIDICFQLLSRAHKLPFRDDSNVMMSPAAAWNGLCCN
jgi:hypothetical protein